MPWRGWRNAEIYDRFVRERPLYRALNRRLVELADVAAARRVLDLACGTGATARACLARLPAAATLVGVDASEAMVEVARAGVDDPRAHFEVATALDLGAAGAGFDRALCNAAFSQFPAPAAVLAALAALLEPGALFVFNLPAATVAGEPAAVHPFQVALARALAARGSTVSRPPEVDPEHLAALLAENGFEQVLRERFVYRGRQDELMELMEIPAMLARSAPGVPERDRAGAVAEARRRTDPAQAVEVPWIYLVARRRPAPPLRGAG